VPCSPKRVGNHARPSKPVEHLDDRSCLRRRKGRASISADRVTVAIQLSENGDNLVGCRNLVSCWVEPNGIEPMTSGLQSQRSPN
jgi:hypothetical protein